MRFYHEIRAIELFKYVTILYVFENNLGNEHNWLYGLIKRTPIINNVYVLYENEKKLGFNTSALSKLMGYDVLLSYCSTGGIQFYKDLITINADHKNGKIDMKNVLIKQLMQIKQFGRKHANGTRVRVITGIH